MSAKEEILNETLRGLDDYGSVILVAIIRHPEGIGFNSLQKEIRKHPKCETMAKTTLSEHLHYLVGNNLVDRDLDENSKLKFKPTKYKTSQYFRNISKEYIAQSTTPEDFLSLMRTEDVATVTKHLMSSTLTQIAECLKAVVSAPEKISRVKIKQLAYNLETMTIAYRERILETKEEAIALNAINTWMDYYEHHQT